MKIRLVFIYIIFYSIFSFGSHKKYDELMAEFNRPPEGSVRQTVFCMGFEDEKAAKNFGSLKGEVSFAISVFLSKTSSPTIPLSESNRMYKSTINEIIYTTSLNGPFNGLKVNTLMEIDHILPPATDGKSIFYYEWQGCQVSRMSKFCMSLNGKDLIDYHHARLDAYPWIFPASKDYSNVKGSKNMVMIRLKHSGKDLKSGWTFEPFIFNRMVPALNLLSTISYKPDGKKELLKLARAHNRHGGPFRLQVVEIEDDKVDWLWPKETLEDSDGRYRDLLFFGISPKDSKNTEIEILNDFICDSKKGPFSPEDSLLSECYRIAATYPSICGAAKSEEPIEPTGASWKKKKGKKKKK